MNNYKDLSDNQLIHLIQDNNNQKAINAFYNRHQKDFLKSIQKHLHEIYYDRSLSPQEIEDDAISESYFAINDAIQRYDFKSANILSFIKSKIRWHFLDLQRENSKRREIALSEFAPHEDDYELENHDYLEANVDKDAFLKEQHKIEILDALHQAAKALKKYPDSAKVFKALYAVFKNDEEKPIPAAAKILKKSRQHVYNKIEEAYNDLPQKLADEIINILNDIH